MYSILRSWQYVGSERSTALAAAILAAQPQRVISNPGAENPALAQQLEAVGIQVENACTLVLLRTGQFDAAPPADGAKWR